MIIIITIIIVAINENVYSVVFTTSALSVLFRILSVLIVLNVHTFYVCCLYKNTC